MPSILWPAGGVFRVGAGCADTGRYVRIWIKDNAGNECVLVTRGPGDVFGEVIGIGR